MKDRFKELDLETNVPEELWMEIYNIVQKTVTKYTPKKKKYKKAKWLCEEALQIAEGRREAKCKGERERYTQLNTGFQRMARRDKKAFFNEQCKETEENNRREKTRVLLHKTVYIKGTFHSKIGTIKDRNGRYIEEAEEIKKRQKEYTK